MLALALLTFWLERTVREDETTPPTRRHDPDYSWSNFTTTTYNRDGVAEQRAVGGAHAAFPGRRHDRAARPARGADQAERAAHDACSAERGALSRDGEEIFLYDNVLLVRDAAPSGPRRA